MNHNDLKAKLEKDFYAFINTLPSRVGETPESAIWDFISRTIDEAARAAAEAAMLESKKHFAFECNGAHGGKGCYETFCEDNSRLGPCKSTDAIEVRAHNAAIAQSSLQLAEHFGETKSVDNCA